MFLSWSLTFIHLFIEFIYNSSYSFSSIKIPFFNSPKGSIEPTGIAANSTEGSNKTRLVNSLGWKSVATDSFSAPFRGGKVSRRLAGSPLWVIYLKFFKRVTCPETKNDCFALRTN